MDGLINVSNITQFVNFLETGVYSGLWQGTKKKIYLSKVVEGQKN